MKRSFLAAGLLTVPLTFGALKAAERCVVQVRQRHTAEAMARWKRESVEQPRRYAREQRALRTRRLLDLVCEPAHVELPYTDALLDDDGTPLVVDLVADLVPVYTSAPELDEDGGRGVTHADDARAVADVHSGGLAGLLPGWPGVLGAGPVLAAPVDTTPPGSPPVVGSPGGSLTPVPEPGTAALAGAGLLATLLARWKMRRCWLCHQHDERRNMLCTLEGWECMGCHAER